MRVKGVIEKEQYLSILKSNIKQSVGKLKASLNVPI